MIMNIGFTFTFLVVLLVPATVQPIQVNPQSITEAKGEVSPEFVSLDNAFRSTRSTSNYIVICQKGQYDIVYTDFIAFLGGTEPANFIKLGIINAFACELTPAAKEFCENHVGVDSIEEDGVVTAQNHVGVQAIEVDGDVDVDVDVGW